MELLNSFLPPYVPTGPISRYLIILLLFAAALSSLSAGFEVAEIRLLNEAHQSEAVNEQTLWAYNTIRHTLFISRLMLIVAIAAMFTAWLYRARVNARAFGCRRLRFGRYWAAIGFAVPIANLFRPLQVVSEVWQTSDPRGIRTSVDWKSMPVPSLVRTWWGVLLASLCLELLSAGLFNSAGVSVERLAVARGAAAAAHLTWVAAAVLAYLVVTGIDRAQEAKWVALHSPELTPDVIDTAVDSAALRTEAVAAKPVHEPAH
jgi:hypothetical protein